MKYYTIYEIDKENNDIINIKDYEDATQLCVDYGLKNKKSIYHYILKDIENVNFLDIKNLLNCRYIIMINKD